MANDSFTFFHQIWFRMMRWFGYHRIIEDKYADTGLDVSGRMEDVVSIAELRDIAFMHLSAYLLANGCVIDEEVGIVIGVTRYKSPTVNPMAFLRRDQIGIGFNPPWVNQELFEVAAEVAAPPPSLELDCDWDMLVVRENLNTDLHVGAVWEK